MHLIDVREQHGPYWAAYQAYRKRERVLDNPAFVPDWFVAKLARERVAAARVAMEQLGAEPMDVFGSEYQRELTAVWAALRTVEQFIRETRTHDPSVAQVVAGLLGAQEIETERERRDTQGALPGCKDSTVPCGLTSCGIHYP